MSKALKQIILHFYNFTGLLCLNCKNGVYEISHVIVVLNILKFLLSIVVLAFMTNILEIDQSAFRTDFNSSVKLSYFTKMSIHFTAIYFHLVASAMFIKQLTIRNEIKKLLNNELMQFEGKYYKRFVGLCFGSVKLGLFSVVAFAVKFFAMMHPSILNFFIYFIYIFPSFFSLGIVSFVKNFENFFVISLQKFNDELKEVTSLKKRKNRSDDIEVYLKFSLQYQKLFDYVNEFNDIFQRQITIGTNGLTILTILNVSF